MSGGSHNTPRSADVVHIHDAGLTDGERRLRDAGWTHKRRGGKRIWKPKDGDGYYSVEVALHLHSSGRR